LKESHCEFREALVKCTALSNETEDTVNELERYLKNATQGLWGKRKLEVKEELEVHILERARKHELSGLTREDAISKTLEELGNARAINHKMAEVHTMPKLLRSMFTAMFAFFAFMTSTTNPAGADRLKPSFEVQCINTTGQRSSFELRPSKYWKNLSNLEMAKVVKPLLDNWGHWGKRQIQFENRIGANLTMSIGSYNLKNGKIIREKTRAAVSCRMYKIGDLEDLREFRKWLPDIQRQFKDRTLPNKK
jgi:hypothetical protein